MSLGWQTIQTTEKMEVGSLENGFKKQIAPQKHKKDPYNYSEGYVLYVKR